MVITIRENMGHTTLDYSEDTLSYLKKDELYYLYSLSDKIEYRIRRKMLTGKAMMAGKSVSEEEKDETENVSRN